MAHYELGWGGFVWDPVENVSLTLLVYNIIYCILVLEKVAIQELGYNPLIATLL